jgi:hypothetical protein
MPKKPLPQFVAPMQASSVKKPFDSPDWIFETKLDGYRAVAVIDSTGKARIWSRNRLPLEVKFPTIRDSVEELKLRSTISAGLMMVNHQAIDTVNANTPVGTHFNYAHMPDPAKAIGCGTWYLKIINDNAGNGDKRETLRLYRGAAVGDYTYANKIIACESCLQSSVILDPQTCLNQIHT